MDKAQKAKSETTIAEAKEAAVLKATALIQDYMDKRYVQNVENFATDNPTIGGYVANGMNNVTEGNYKFVVSNGELKVFDKDANTSSTDEVIVTGTIDSTTGKITWNGTPADNGQGTGNVDQGGPTIVGGTVQVGQKVNYTPPSTTIANVNLPEGTSIEGTKVAALGNTISGATITGTSVTANQITDWVVLDVDSTTGEVLIVPNTVNTSNKFAQLQLTGMDGYNNAIQALNKVSEMYLNPTYAESARSITIEDVNKVEGHTPNGEVTEIVFQNDYGMNDNLDIVYQGGNTTEIATETDDSELGGKKTITLNYKVYNSTAETGQYEYSLGTSFLSRGNFGLASRCVSLGSSSCDFSVRCLSYGNVNYDALFVVSDYGSANDYDHNDCVLPVVSLKSGINMTWDDTNGAWNLSE